MQFGKNNHLVWQKRKIFTCYSVFLCVLLCIIASGISNELFLMTIPYDGGASGSFIGDAIRNITGRLYFNGDNAAYLITSAGGAFSPNNSIATRVILDSINRPTYPNIPNGVLFSAENAGVPTAQENRGASLSAWAYISY